MSGATSAPGAPASPSAPAAEPPGRWQRLPEWLRPRERERRGRGELRRVESTLLVLAFVGLAVATVNDTVRQAHVNERLTVDVLTWRAVAGRAYPGHAVQNVSIEQDLVHYTTRDVVCGNVWSAAPGTTPQLCLVMTGPTMHGGRAARGGYYLLPYFPDARPYRYACFGTAVAEDLCGAPTVSGAPDFPLTEVP
jgi:hypothetical protein